ncbi:unnamed protein product, partial [Staurois parvus]
MSCQSAPVCINMILHFQCVGAFQCTPRQHTFKCTCVAA